MAEKVSIPQNWQVPASISARIAEVPGVQRLLEADGHLVLLLHKLPTPASAQRDIRLFWRSPDGTWASNDLGAGIMALQRHVTEFNDRVLQLEEEEHRATSAQEYFQIRHQLIPIYRAARNMSATISRGYEMFPDDRGLLACRNLAATVERTAELLREDATDGLEYLMAEQAELQALAGRRLNIIAAIFFPILAFASIFGMNLYHGFENKAPWLFWLFVAIGILIGMAMMFIVFKTGKGRVKEMKDKIE